jgi:serine/threonine-protein kinase
MAEVWEGHDEVLTRQVAVKVLQAHLAEDGIFLERFRREAITAARLAHPGVVATFDTGVDHGTAYIVMELVRGRTLRQLLSEQGALEPWLAVAIARQIADALAHAHQAGLVHRDIKPANVLLTDDEWGGLRVKVTDFGIAKAGTGSGHDLTSTGIVLGTPKYLSPEQIKGEEPDDRADLYSLGIVLFEMLTGQPPFAGTTDMATALAHLNDRAPRVSSKVRSVPAPLDRLVADLLAKDPNRRVPSASVLCRRLDSLGLAPPLPGRPGGRRPGWRQRDGTLAVPLSPVRSPTGRTPARHVTGGVPSASPSGQPAGAVSAGDPPRFGAAAATSVLSPGVPAGGGVPRNHAGIDHGQTPSDPRTPTGRPPAATGRARRSNARHPATWMVVGLVVVGAVLASVLLSSPGSKHRAARGTTGAGTSSSEIPIAAVTPFMANSRSPDDVPGLPYTFDHNPQTAWHSDVYRSATFGNLYPGMGLAIHLARSASLHKLLVTSSTRGWAAQTYVSTVPVATGQSVTAWGRPADTRTGVNGSVTLSLAGRQGQWVLLWLTNLGPRFQMKVAELAVS